MHLDTNPDGLGVFVEMQPNLHDAERHTLRDWGRSSAGLQCRCRVVGVVPERPDGRDRSVRGREVPDPGEEPDRTDPAAARRAAGESDPRLPAHRYDHRARRARRHRRQGWPTSPATDKARPSSSTSSAEVAPALPPPPASCTPDPEMRHPVGWTDRPAHERCLT